VLAKQNLKSFSVVNWGSGLKKAVMLAALTFDWKPFETARLLKTCPKIDPAAVNRRRTHRPIWNFTV
jgi:hypothetical protein